MPKLIEKLNEWRLVHPNIINSFNLLVAPTYMDPGNFPSGFFKEDMQRILDLMPRNDVYQETHYDQMKGVAMRIENTPHRPNKLEQLKHFLDLMDARKKTNWRTTFPWLVEVIDS